MDASRRSEKNERPVDINDWSKDHVRQWMLEIPFNQAYVDILYSQGINGADLLHLKEAYHLVQNLPFNEIEYIIKHVDHLKQKTVKETSRSLKPYPFNRTDAAHRYRENSTLDVTETGAIDLIQPCHEFKAFTNTQEEKDRMKKYTYEVIRFAAACMNSRTNGTIHFGVADKPHGLILGVSVLKNDHFDEQQKHAISRHFLSQRSVEIANRCIKPPRFVEVLKADMTSSGKYVIEVDVEPSSIVCEDRHFNTFHMDKNEEPTAGEIKRRKQAGKSFFIRERGSSRNLFTANSQKEYDDYVANTLKKIMELRKDAEEKHSVPKIHSQGSELCEMITGGGLFMDRSHFTSYIVVANKSHPVQLENLDFLNLLNLVAVLDFDPDSTKNGLNRQLGKGKMFNNHLPADYKNTGPVEDIVSSLKLTKNTSWVFCNGGIDGEAPSDADKWLTEKGSSVRDVVSLLCQKVLRPKKVLVIFLLLSQVSDAKDPMLETFSMFQKELGGQNQILSMSDNETSYTYWKDLIKNLHKIDISKSIYELSFTEINGTVLSLWSQLRKLIRFLPCVGGAKVVLPRKTEESLHMLNILCVNQCEGGHEDKQIHEENFYKGGKVSWWNFYYSEQPESMSVIKRDKLDYIINTVIPNLKSQKTACVFFNIFHPPGWGGTTLAMHVLWTLKDRFRCAVLQDTTDDCAAVAEQVVQLLTYETKGKPSRLPVLLMTDDLQDIRKVQTLQRQIEKECLNQGIFSNSPQVIIVNCMRFESCEPLEGTGDAVFIPSYLSEKEQELFGEKLNEFKKTNTNTETFYVSMIVNNFSSTYIQNVVKKTLKDFNFKDKDAQLFAILVLLHVYSKTALLSVSTCEEFLDLQTKAESSRVEDAFGKFSSLLKRCTVFSKVTVEGMRVINSQIAQHCLEELIASHGVTKTKITILLLSTQLFYDNTLEKKKFAQDVQDMLVKRQCSASGKDEDFSPLFQDITKETPGIENTLLLKAADCFSKSARIFQVLSRYFIKREDFNEALFWAQKAKDHSRENSYICDTVSQVFLCELKQAFDRDNNDHITKKSLDRYLTLAESAAAACKETQKIAKEEAMARLQRQNDHNTYNTAGHLGELQSAATVIEMLQRRPFVTGFTYNNCLTKVLLGKKNIEDLSRTNPELKGHCEVLKKHECFLFQLKDTMKQHFDFFRCFFGHLVPFFAEKDKQVEETKRNVSRFFQLYTELFWEGKIVWMELYVNDHLSTTEKIEQTREYLERNKGESYTGLLEYLDEEDSVSAVEEIIRQYDFILDSNEKREMDYVNFIYASVVLANINPASWYLRPYKCLCELLFRTKCFDESLPLLFITVLLLWQKKKAHPELPTLVSQMKKSFSTELKPVSNGKRAAVHFYFGKDKGYGGLISQRDLNSCLGSGQDISTQWNDDKIWKKVKDSKKLCRVSGEICDGFINVAGVRVDPMFRSQLNRQSGTVTFFMGFSMNGPVALDINYEPEASQA